MYEKELEQLGLSDKEAKTYLASLELGPTTAQDIAKRSGLKRPTVYFAIDRLTELGLMSSFEKGKKRYFVAESPERLVSLVAAQIKKAQVLQEELQRTLPGLNELFRLTGERPRVRFFEGKEGIQAIQEDILKSGAKSIEEIYPRDEFLKLFSFAEREHYVAKIQKKRIRIRSIYTSKITPTGFIRNPLAQMRFIPYDRFPISSDIVLYANKVAVATYKGKLIGVIIESKEIADSMRVIFNLAWEAAGKHDTVGRKRK